MSYIVYDKLCKTYCNIIGCFQDHVWTNGRDKKRQVSQKVIFSAGRFLDIRLFLDILSALITTTGILLLSTLTLTGHELIQRREFVIALSSMSLSEAAKNTATKICRSLYLSWKLQWQRKVSAVQQFSSLHQITISPVAALYHSWRYQGVEPHQQVPAGWKQPFVNCPVELRLKKGYSWIVYRGMNWLTKTYRKPHRRALFLVITSRNHWDM